MVARCRRSKSWQQAFYLNTQTVSASRPNRAGRLSIGSDNGALCSVKTRSTLRSARASEALYHLLREKLGGCLLWCANNYVHLFSKVSAHGALSFSLYPFFRFVVRSLLGWIKKIEILRDDVSPRSHVGDRHIDKVISSSWETEPYHQLAFILLRDRRFNHSDSAKLHVLKKPFLEQRIWTLRKPFM